MATYNVDLFGGASANHGIEAWVASVYNGRLSVLTDFPLVEG